MEEIKARQRVREKKILKKRIKIQLIFLLRLTREEGRNLYHV
jgi:hypothetical protein